MVADTDDREPWPMWRDLPKGSRFAVDVGLVRPIPCPDCSGDPGKLDGDIELLKQSLVQLYPLINRVADKTPVANKTESNETVRMIRLLREICYLIHKDG